MSNQIPSKATRAISTARRAFQHKLPTRWMNAEPDPGWSDGISSLPRRHRALPSFPSSGGERVGIMLEGLTFFTRNDRSLCRTPSCERVPPRKHEGSPTRPFSTLSWSLSSLGGRKNLLGTVTSTNLSNAMGRSDRNPIQAQCSTRSLFGSLAIINPSSIMVCSRWYSPGDPKRRLSKREGPRFSLENNKPASIARSNKLRPRITFRSKNLWGLNPFSGGRGGRTDRISSLLQPLTSLLNHRLPGNTILWILMALNLLVFLSWTYSVQVVKKFNDPGPFLFMTKNFLFGEPNLREGRWWTLITSCLSHKDLPHFLINMVSLSFMAPPVLALVGPSTFLGLYLGAGIVSCGVSAFWNRFVEPLLYEEGQGRGRDGFSQGASGSVYAIMTTFACVQPNATFLIFFVLPAPAWACVTGFFAWDLYSASVHSKNSKVDSAGHVGGILAGLLFWRFGLKGIRIL
ncbi:rhomboid-domain-containing protein [Violaceomyces palustris]|uniref:Rhomboid-domain-containing protein n=1 Tax=Violaceomyces palustris TaxID=1673888 RepID=A0ACD0NLR1_9BASI|nr:rhomboid-domain-containing protein [Violaceomyces palustris]